MKTLRRIVFEKVISLRPIRALQVSCEIFGIDAVRIHLPSDSPLYSDNGGNELLLRADHVIFPAVVKDKQWQPDAVDFLGAHASNGPCVLVDIGANLGLVARQLLNRFPGITAAVCFEPHPINFNILSENLRHLPQCRLVQAALGSAEGHLRFYEDARNVGNYSLSPDAMRGQHFRTIEVPCLEANEGNIVGPLPEGTRSLPILWKSDTQGFDEIIAIRLPNSFWSRVQAGVMEIWRIERPNFDRQRLGEILGQFAVRRFSSDPERNISVEEILRFSAGTDYQARDVLFART
jgi:FkbM family methyltransferase